ncbi:MAG: 5-(carboxyamino)imidazole ribonucleotide mutase [Phycisphaeraceae bacterium]|nr:MAG: 5-(carboxyamino)imidazole ribonucleotide mutase [Phycisphaeraceae bacterium]
MNHANPLVGILMGSASDWPTMKKTSEMLDKFGIPHEAKALSAHRNPEQVAAYAKAADGRGIRLIICAAGGAAHLAGVVASLTHLPVLGVPTQAWSLDGLDSLLSMAQMPKGVPVATFAIGSHGATNAAIFAAQVLAGSDAAIRAKLLAFRTEQNQTVQELPRE